ncbi:MAG: hypothetical protein ACRDBY_12800 [Cetobacterium sp.]
MKEVRNFKELMDIESETHYIEYDDYDDSYWIMSKDKNCNICGRSGYYLSTHTFYESYSHIPQEVLNKLGFNVKIIGS